MSSSKKMPAAKFIPLYLAAVDAKLTRDEFAKKIGVQTETVYQRVYDLNQKHGADLPQLPLEERVSKAEAVAHAIAQYRASKKQGKPAAESKSTTDELEELLKG